MTKSEIRQARLRRASKKIYVINKVNFNTHQEVADHYGISNDKARLWVKKKITPFGDHINTKTIPRN